MTSSDDIKIICLLLSFHKMLTYIPVYPKPKNDYAIYKLIEKHITQIQEYRSNALQLFDNISNDMVLSLL